MKSNLAEILFILNQSSGRKKAGGLIDELKKRELHFFISPNAVAFEKFISAEKDKWKIIIICGGDGTVNSIVNQMHDLDVVFGIYPLGSGNGLARELGFKKDLDVLIKSIENLNPRQIDLIKINERYCCNVAGVGFDGYVAHYFDKSNSRGIWSYAKESAKAIFKYKPVFAKIIIDDKQVIEGEYFMINIANTRQFGGNAYIAPQADFNDGLIELALVKKIPFYRLPMSLLKLLTKGLRNSKYIAYHQAKKINLKVGSQFYQIDGEPLDYKMPLEITIPKKIKFITV